MRLRLTALALVIAVCAAFASAAQGHLVAHPKSHLLKDVAASQWINYKHARYVCRNGAHYNKRWSCRAKIWLLREYRETYKAMHPVSAFPAHHLLWMCISSSEGSPTSVNPNGHYGMLQMTYNWGGFISGKASDHSQLEQEQAAERAYVASGYSRQFLIDQWFKWDGRYDCLRYA